MEKQKELTTKYPIVVTLDPANCEHEDGRIVIYFDNEKILISTYIFRTSLYKPSNKQEILKRLNGTKGIIDIEFPF